MEVWEALAKKLENMGDKRLLLTGKKEEFQKAFVGKVAKEKMKKVVKGEEVG